MQEKSLHTDAVRKAIDEAIARLPGTATRKDKTKLVARLLFLEHGIYPSAKVILDYTHHGSLTDISRDLRIFWSELRECMSAKVSAPFLPEDLLESYAQALSGVWDLALEKARNDFEKQRLEAEEAVRKAQAEAVDMLRRIEISQNHVHEITLQKQAELERREAAEMRAQALTTENEGLQDALIQWKEKLVFEERARQEAEQQFSRDLEAERAERQKEAERFAGEIRFAKLQIEQARISEKELRQQLEASLRSKELGLISYRQRASVAEEALAAARLELAEMAGQVKVLESNFAEALHKPKELLVRPTPRLVSKLLVKRKKLR